jgi:poly [ADP-ribose] polymerase 10/14/15
LDPPTYWDEVKNPLEGQLFRLDPRDAKTADEYRRVQNAFLLTLPAKNFRIYSIDRVQNVSLWQSYAVKKSSICGREEDQTKALRKYVRCWLFHGCPGDIVPKILQQGFNRSFCGKNATFYGKGVYFARDAKYSTYPLYCRPDPQGVQSIFLVRAVVGQYCKGVKDALTPDVRDARRNLLYDTTVDNMADPSIFVTYHDAQAYPEYRIRFTQSNPAQGHPQAGQKRPAGYKPNLLEGVEDVKPRAASIDAQPQPQRVAPAPVAPAPVAQPVAPARQQFMVQIPAGVAPGAVMTVRAPDGRLLQVQVPAGAVPGSTIQVAA